jgi:hypothetical protein
MNLDDVYARLYSLYLSTKGKLDKKPETGNLPRSDERKAVIISQYRKAQAEQVQEEIYKFSQLQNDLLSEKSDSTFLTPVASVEPMRIKILTIGTLDSPSPLHRN